MDYETISGGFVHKIRKTRGHNGLKFQHQNTTQDIEEQPMSFKEVSSSLSKSQSTQNSTDNNSLGVHINSNNNNNIINRLSPSSVAAILINNKSNQVYDADQLSAPHRLSNNNLEEAFRSNNKASTGIHGARENQFLQNHVNISEALSNHKQTNDFVVSQDSQLNSMRLSSLSSDSLSNSPKFLTSDSSNSSLSSHVFSTTSSPNTQLIVDKGEAAAVLSSIDLEQLAANGQLVSGQDGQLYVVLPNDPSMFAAAVAAGLSPHLSSGNGMSSVMTPSIALSSTTATNTNSASAYFGPNLHREQLSNNSSPHAALTSSSLIESSKWLTQMGKTSLGQMSGNLSVSTGHYASSSPAALSSHQPAKLGARKSPCLDQKSVLNGVIKGHASKTYHSDISNSSSDSSINGGGGGYSKDIRRRVSHNEVERRRRDRINTWIAELHKLLPPDEQNRSQQHSKGAILKRVCEYFRQVSTQMKQFENTKWAFEQQQSENVKLQKALQQVQLENQYLRRQLQTTLISNNNKNISLDTPPPPRLFVKEEIMDKSVGESLSINGSHRLSQGLCNKSPVLPSPPNSESEMCESSS